MACVYHESGAVRYYRYNRLHNYGRGMRAARPQAGRRLSKLLRAAGADRAAALYELVREDVR